MTTLATMIDEIQDDTLRTSSDDETAIRTKITAAIRHYQPKRFWFNESRAVTFSTVSGTDLYRFGAGLEITTEFYRIDGVYVVEGGRQHGIRSVDYSDLETLIETTPQQGRPFQRAFINKALRFYPCPDAIYTVRATGHVKLAAPASDAEADNAWMTEAYDLIMSRAKAELYVHRWSDDTQANALLPLAVAAEKEAFSALKDATGAKIGTGQLVPTDF